MYLTETVSKSKHITLLLLLLISSLNSSFFLSTYGEKDSNQVSKNFVENHYSHQVAQNDQLERKSQENDNLLNLELPSRTITQSTINSLKSVQKLTVYSTKSAFTITDNSQFVLNGFTGSGTSGNPYVLEYYHFQGSGSTTQISISNTDVYFVLRHLTYSSNTQYAYFISLSNVENGVILNNTVEMASVGVFLNGRNTTAISIVNNTFMDSANGIFAYDIKGSITIFNNTIKDNNRNGIWFNGGRTNNIIENNTITNNQYNGIYFDDDFYGTYNSTIRNNILTNNYFYINPDSPTIDETERHQYLVENNLVNGKPIDFFQDANNPTFSSDPVQIFVFNSSNINIKDIPEISGPVTIIYSNYVSISNVTVNNTLYPGLEIDHTTNLTVNNNKIINATTNGLSVSYSQGNIINNLISHSFLCPSIFVLGCNGLEVYAHQDNGTIANNSIQNFQIGMDIKNSNNQTVTGNIITNSSSDGIFLNSANDLTILNNKIDARNSYAINLNGVTSVQSIRDNRFYNSSITLSDFIAQSDFGNNTYNDEPIVIFQNLQNQVIAPNATISAVYGQFYFENSNFVELKDIKVLYDISFSNSNNITLRNMTTLDNGLNFSNSGNLTIFNNSVRSLNHGIQIFTSSIPLYNVFIENNTIIGYQTSGSRGILLTDIYYFKITNNIINNYDSGIYIDNGLNSTVNYNSISSTGSHGIVLTGANSKVKVSFNVIQYLNYGIYINFDVTDNEVFNNTIYDGSKAIYVLLAINNSIFNNYIFNSSYGFHLEYAKKNMFTNNNLLNNSRNIFLEFATFNSFINNTFNGSTYHNEIISTSVNNTFIGNLFTNNNYYVYLDATSDNNTFKDNKFIDTLYVAIQINSVNNFITHNDFIGNNWTNTNFPPGKQIQILNPSNFVLSNYYSDHNNIDFDWNDIADTPYFILDTTVKDDFPKVRPIYFPDIFAPIFYILPANNSVFNATGFLLNYNISERSITEIYINGMVNSSKIDSGTNMSYLTEGTYNITILATDLSGNVAITQISFVVDTIAPVIIFSRPINATYNVLSLNVSYYVIESSNYSIQFYINGVQNSIELVNNTFWLFSEEFNNITVYTVDQVGNSALWYVFFSIDVSPPVLTIFTPLNTTYTLPWVIINYSISDFSMFNTTIYIDGAPNQTVTNPTSVIQFANGYHNITFMITDIFNQTTIKSVFFTVDILPYVNILSIENKTYTTNELKLNYTLLFTNKVEIYIDNVLNQTELNNGSIITFLEDGPHNITIRGLDSLNRSKMETVLFSIDTVLPTVDILSPINTTYDQIIVTLEYNTTKSVLLDIIINGVHNASTTLSGIQITLFEGSHNITIVVTDYLNRTVSKSVYFTIELTPDTRTTPISTNPISTTVSSQTPSTTSESETSQNSETSQTTSIQTSPFSIFGILFGIVMISLYTIVISRRRNK